MEAIHIHFVMLISPGRIGLSTHSRTLLAVHLNIKKDFMAPFNGWGSTVSGLQSNQGCTRTKNGSVQTLWVPKKIPQK